MDCCKYIAPEIKDVFSQHDLLDFDAWWSLEQSYVDDLNHRGKGWSGVSFLELNGKGAEVSVYVKRQENYKHRTLAHPISGIPTFKQEFDNIQILNHLNVPTITPLYFEQRQIGGNTQAILVTKDLAGYENLIAGFGANISVEMQKKVMARCGEVARQLNDAGYIHNALYPKHLFYRIEDAEVDVRLIDIERLRWRPWKRRSMCHEISRFIRRRCELSDVNLQDFLDSYLTSGQGDLSQSSLARNLYSKISG